MKLGEYNFLERCYVVVLDEDVEFYADVDDIIPNAYLDYEVVNEDRVTDNMKIYYIKKPEKTNEDNNNDLEKMFNDFVNAISEIADKYVDGRSVIITGDNEGFEVKFVKK